MSCDTYAVGPEIVAVLDSIWEREKAGAIRQLQYYKDTAKLPYTAQDIDNKTRYNMARVVARRVGQQAYDVRGTESAGDLNKGELRGRSPYFEPNNVSHFNSKVTLCWEACDGLLLCVVESLRVRNSDSKRGFRGIVFDILGTVIHDTATQGGVDGLQNTDSSTADVKAKLKNWLDIVHPGFIAECQQAMARRLHQIDGQRRDLLNFTA